MACILPIESSVTYFADVKGFLGPGDRLTGEGTCTFASETPGSGGRINLGPPALPGQRGVVTSDPGYAPRATLVQPSVALKSKPRPKDPVSGFEALGSLTAMVTVMHPKRPCTLEYRSRHNYETLVA